AAEGSALHLDVLSDGHPFVKRATLRDVRETFERRRFERTPVDLHPARGCGREAKQALEGRRLAGPIGTEQSADRSALDFQRQIRNRGEVAKTFGEVLDRDHSALDSCGSG